MDMYTIIFTNFPFGLWNERKNLLKIGLFYVIWILVFFVLDNFLFSINPFPTKLQRLSLDEYNRLVLDRVK